MHFPPPCGPNFALEIPAGQNNLRLIVPIDDDEFDEFDETFTFP